MLAGLGALIGAATEPLIPSFMQHLLDAGFQQRALPLWQIPLIIVGLFGLRGLAHSLAPRLLHAGFLVALFWSLSRSLERLDVSQVGLLQLHGPAAAELDAEMLDTLADLKAGKVPE